MDFIQKNKNNKTNKQTCTSMRERERERAMTCTLAKFHHPFTRHMGTGFHDLGPNSQI